MEDPEDCFALLGFPRSARLEADAVRERHHERVRALAQEGGGGAGEEALHRAVAVLADPARRLRHLLELHTGGARSGSAGMVLGPDLLERFAAAERVLRRADDVWGRLRAASSALGRALLAPEEAEAQRLLGDLIADLTTLRDREDANLDGLSPTDAVALETALARFRVLDKWLAEARERRLRFLSGPG